MKTITPRDITLFLPHRRPFLMVDNILSITDEQVLTSFRVPEDCIFNENGFFNEMGLIENAAQTCSTIVGRSYIENGELTGKKTRLIGFISTIKKVTTHSCPAVGKTIRSAATLKSRADTPQYSICTMECSVSENGKELLSCEMNLIIREVD